MRSFLLPILALKPNYKTICKIRKPPKGNLMIQFFHRIPKSKLVTSRESYLINACRGKRVLHIGCVDAGMTDLRVAQENLLHINILNAASYAVGIDVSADGIKKLQHLGIDNLYAVNPNDPTPVNEKFDVIIAGEVIEHVSDAGSFLEKYLPNLSDSGVYILTAPNAFCLTSAIRLLRGIETVHEDHVSYYSYFTLKKLLSRYNLTPKRHAFYSGFRGGRFMRIIKLPLFFILKKWPQFGEGIIFIAQRSD